VPGAPLLLALETATPRLSLALLRGEELVDEVEVASERTHAEVLLPTLDGLLGLAKVTLEEVEAFAVSIGPGSFTGLRVGVATVRGLVFGTPRPVVPVSTLAALACAASGEDLPVAALLDARRGELYAAVYPAGAAGQEPLHPEAVVTPEELLAKLPRPCLLVGEGAHLHAEAFRRGLGPALRLAPPDLSLPRARHVGRLGLAGLRRGEGRPGSALVPRYLRRAEAEVRRTGNPVE
jgi:tRNA threonylcarbamoyladenosine biosynthesis protein TsaB